MTFALDLLRRKTDKKSMPYSALAVANKFIELSKADGKTLTNMQLQKLVFLTQGYGMALLGHTIFYNNVHAWQWGPVIPKLYKYLQQYGSGAVTEPIPCDEGEIPNESKEMAIIIAIWKTFGSYSGSQLSAITHVDGSPWSKVWAIDKFGVISNESICSYYGELVNKSKAPA